MSSKFLNIFVKLSSSKLVSKYEIVLNQVEGDIRIQNSIEEVRNCL